MMEKSIIQIVQIQKEYYVLFNQYHLLKLRLAKVGSERIEEINNPKIAMDRMKQIYEKKGYSNSWIEQRERGIITRIGRDYAILTNEIYNSGFGLIANEYKNIKGLHDSQNLRDSMTNIKLALTNLGEATAVEFHRENNNKGLNQLKSDMTKAGNVLNKAKQEIENELKRSVVTPQNYIELTKAIY